MPKSTFPAAATGLPISGPLACVRPRARATIAPVAEMPRRAFLSQLAKLPLIGGGLSIIGQPKAVAEPVTMELLDNYMTWLVAEYIGLYRELQANGHKVDINTRNAAAVFHPPFGWDPEFPAPSARAAVVLSAVGCDWKDRRNV
jgi:hypothetical protein